MTNVYQENQGNGHHVAEAENSEMAVASNQDISDLSSTEQQLKLCRQMFSNITTAMQKGKDIYSLTSIATEEIRGKLECDRTLIYRFNSADSGTVIAESRASSWTPAKDEKLPAIIFGWETNHQYLEPVVLQVNNQAEVSPYQSQLLEKYQIKSSLSLPIFLKDEIWGLLVVQSCSTIRQWQELEINLLSQIAVDLNYKFQSFEFQKHLQQQSQEQKTIAKVIDKIQNASDLNQIFQTTTKEVRQLIECDRVSVYRFNPDWSGEYVAESVTPGWMQLVGVGIKTIWEDTHLQETKGGRYAKGEYFAVNDIHQIGHSSCHIDILEQFQVQAYVIAPIFIGQKLWGLLAAYQNSGTREWQSWEISLLSQIAKQAGIAVSQAEYIQQAQQKSHQLAQIAEQEKALTKVINRIRQSLDLDAIFRNTTKEVRQLLQCDRVSVYRFNPDWSGVYIGESVAPGWTHLVGKDIKTVWEDTHLQETQGGRYAKGESFAVNDIYQVGHSQCHIDVLEQFEVKAYVLVPVFVGQKLWGLLAAYQNTGAREWLEQEISLLAQVGVQFGIGVSQAEKFEQERQKSLQLAQVAEKEKALTKVVNRIRQSTDVDTIFKTTTREVRDLLECDRVGVYRFNPDWSGEFIAESLGSGWTPLFEKELETEKLQDVSDCSVRRLAGGKKVQDTYLQETQGGRYPEKQSYVVDDIYQAGFPKCYLELLEQFEAKAYMTVPIFKGQELWGLLATYQNSGSRHWEESELSWLNQIALQFGVAISQAEYIQQVEEQSQKLARTSERQQSLIELTRKIGETLAEKAADSSQFDTILQTTVVEVRQLLQADRSVVYRFNPDWSGEFIAESMGKGWLPFRERNIDPELLQQNGHCDTFQNLTSFYKDKDKYLQDNQGGRYKQKSVFVVNDVAKAGFPKCYTELLEQFEAKAYLTVPIFKENKLWGLLATYQNTSTRNWEEFEISSMQQIAVLLGVAMQQAETVKKLELQSQEMTKTAELERAVANVVEKIRESLEVKEVFITATKELRSLLKVDRSVIYRFNPDWSGEFVAESVGNGWIRLLNLVSADTNLRETQGGRYAKRQVSVVSDIYTAGYDSCHVELLEQYQARAYIIAPIFQGQKLWGLLAVYQNSSTRQWQETDVQSLSKIGDRLGIALQQAEYLEKLQAQSLQVVEAAGREKEAKEYLQKGAMRLLSAVRPALDGDLTVRAPLSEDELGTIADAYNNTLQALRQIVIQVQAAAEQVAQKSDQSNASLSGLTTLAQQQSKEMDEALEEIQEMVDSTQAVVGNAELVQAVVEEANHTVEMGDEAMNRTVEAIQGIRETVAQTSKKIKRLSESSQKISKVVSLISNFATQTNVLALNAAIEATRAGEYGKGFAVVADEVRSLSRQSAAATIEIEKLVQEIQEETGEVSVAMETGIQQVVEGTALVNETRMSLNAIVTATAEISKLLQQITDATQGQMLQSVSVTASMKDVAKIANKTSTEASNIAIVFRELSETAQELLASASKFKVN